jgi:hypothetical protein
MKRFYIFLLGATLASGCARAHAKAAPDNPPLDMPAPPPRVVESIDENPQVPVELPAEPARSTIRRPPPPPQTRTDSPRPESKPETPPAEPAKPPAAEEPAPPAASPLQTTPAGDVDELEKTIRAAMARAQHDLNRIDYRSLNPEARDQYESAKSLIRQADDAIRVKNFEFAKTVADKAAIVAAQLAGRR